VLTAVATHADVARSPDQHVDADRARNPQLQEIFQMRTVIYRRYGNPADVLEAVEAQAPPAPGDREVSIRVSARPVHPGDLLGVQGRYRAPGDLSEVAIGGARPGFEGVGVIEAVGAAVKSSSGLTVGARVAFFPARGAWGEKVNASIDFVTLVPSDISDDVASQLHVNPMTAIMLLRAAQAAGAESGGEGAIALTAAGSSVAKLVTTLARQLDIPVVNIVRRSSSLPALASLQPGVGLVATDEDRWQERVRAATGGRPIRVVLDPVGGETASEMLQLLTSGGTFVSYGDLSGEPIATPALNFSVRDIRIHGVSVGRWASLPEAVRGEDLRAALSLAQEGPKLFPVAAHYDLADVAKAAAHAMHPSKQGSVLLTSR